jgi:hypothetical protein
MQATCAQPFRSGRLAERLEALRGFRYGATEQSVARRAPREEPLCPALVRAPTPVRLEEDVMGALARGVMEAVRA